MRLWEFGRVDPKLEEPNVALMAGQMVVGAFFVTILFASLVLATLGTWPGHPGGKLYPLYVPEHYGKHSKENRPGFFWLFFQNSRAAKLNVFQNSSKCFAKLKENILKLNISETFVVVDLFSILQIK